MFQKTIFLLVLRTVKVTQKKTVLKKKKKKDCFESAMKYY